MTLASIARLQAKFPPPATVFLRYSKTPNWSTTQRSVDPYVGYRALWMKVIIRAAFDWVSYRDATKLELKKEAEKAEKWLFEPNELFNSFDNICHLVDLPPDKIRVWARALTKEHVAKIEHLERESLSPIALLEAERRLIEDVDEDL